MKTPRTAPAASRIEASAADTLQGGAADPAKGAAPRVTIDANAPTDPLIRDETAALREDAAGSGADGAEAKRAPDRADAPAVDTPVTGLGGEADSSAVMADTLRGRSDASMVIDDGSTKRERVSDDQASGVYREAGDMSFVKLFDVIVMDADGDGGVLLDRSVRISSNVGYALVFKSTDDVERCRLITNVSPEPRSTMNVNVLGLPAIGSSAEFGILTIRGISATEIERERQRQTEAALGLVANGRAASAAPASVFPLPAATGPDQVPLAAPAVQPTAVVDPAFVSVAASAKVVEVAERRLKVNTQIRSEPDHFYGVRYVDVDGAPRIRRLEAFVGPTDTFLMAGDFLPPLRGSDVQIGVLASPVDMETGQRLTPEGFLALRSLGDGSAIAVTVDGRKIRVGLLP